MVAGSAAVLKLVDLVAPVKLASIGILLVALPLWTVVVPVSWPVACLAVVLCGCFVPLVNAPMMAIITTRPPAAVRAKVMSAVMTASGIGGPCGRLLVGPLYRAWGNPGVWAFLAGGVSLGALLFVAVAVRSSGRDAADVARVAAVTHGEA